MTTKSDAECEAAIKQFAEITQSDEAFAHSILQDVNYDLETALTKYFSGQDADAHEGTAAIIAASDGSNGNLVNNAPTNFVALNDSDEDNDLFSYEYDDSTNDDDTEASDTQDEAENLSKEIKEEMERKKRLNETPLELTLMSWNVDGLDTGNLDKRFIAVLYTIAKRNPEIVFLQEVVEAHMHKLMDLMEKMYNIFISDPEFPYFCVTLVSKNIRIVHDKVVKFEETKMGRSAIIVDAEWQRLKLKLINTHLESMTESSAERKKQFSFCLNKIAREPEGHLAIFGGDLNVRDHEVPKLPDGVKDAWMEDGGGHDDTRFTWDMRRNDNKGLDGGRMRFDRIYYRGGPYRHVEFSLDGMQRIRNVHRFPSDHFAVVCRFYDVDLSQEQT